jgi:hypothetical protein
MRNHGNIYPVPVNMRCTLRRLKAVFGVDEIRTYEAVACRQSGHDVLSSSTTTLFPIGGLVRALT